MKDKDELIFAAVDAVPTSSEYVLGNAGAEIVVPVAADDISAMSPVDKELASDALPELPRENRAWLQMQSPTKLYFYWSFRDNPYLRLQRIFGGAAGNYTLVAKLADLTTGREELYPVESEGFRWFDVDAGAEYRADIGFYAPNRPFIRILYSNKAFTPRKVPSPRAASAAEWTATADRFARVLDASGFARDAFDVALAGDDAAAGDLSARSAFLRFVDRDVDLSGILAEDLRHAMLFIATGLRMEDLRSRISRRLFEILSENSSALAEEKAAAALESEYAIEPLEEREEDEASAAVFGNSLVNFPRRLRTRLKDVPGYRPVSSPSLPS